MLERRSSDQRPATSDRRIVPSAGLDDDEDYDE
jgi:hypothetical protein